MSHVSGILVGTRNSRVNKTDEGPAIMELRVHLEILISEILLCRIQSSVIENKETVVEWPFQVRGDT